jgi:cytochrome P450
VLSGVLSPPVLKKLRAGFEEKAEALITELVAKRRFDAIGELAEAFPLSVFPDAMGLPQQGREKLLPHAEMLFNSFGPRNTIFEQSLHQASFEWVEHLGRRETLGPGLGLLIHKAAEKGNVSKDDAAKLVRALVQAGLDTTVHAIGASLHCLARFPNQWERLRADPSFASSAFNEAVRFESPVQTFFRTTMRGRQLSGVQLNDGDKVLVFLGSANRDPARWEAPDAYDIGRDTTGHLGFGAGIHRCVGQLLARMEGEVVLTALARHARTLKLAGDPVRRLNNTLRGLTSLPVEVEPA